LAPCELTGDFVFYDGPVNPQPSIEELQEEVAQLKAELARVREELRRVRRDHHETPPHYL
jgi:vacuolar-type H+-ATPase subunit I/STV1